PCGASALPACQWRRPTKPAQPTRAISSSFLISTPRSGAAQLPSRRDGAPTRARVRHSTVVKGVDQRLRPLVDDDALAHPVGDIAEAGAGAGIREADRAAGTRVAEGALVRTVGVAGDAGLREPEAEAHADRRVEERIGAARLLRAQPLDRGR